MFNNFRNFIFTNIILNIFFFKYYLALYKVYTRKSYGIFSFNINDYLILQPDWKIVDPICTFVFSILVLITTFNILRDTMIVLMEGMPKGVNFGDVLETFTSISGVVRVHNLRVWALSPDKIALAAHLAVGK